VAVEHDDNNIHLINVNELLYVLPFTDVTCHLVRMVSIQLLLPSGMVSQLMSVLV